MVRILLIFLLAYLLAGCQGNTSGPASTSDPKPGGNQTAALELDAQPQAGNWRVTLAAEGAVDLYQAAGTLVFPPGAYEVLAIEAGGGLGGPQECFFAGKETTPGKVDFAYTRRFYGPGRDGEVALVSIIVAPHGDFSLADFQVDRDQGALLIRDSAKQPIEVSGEVQ
jgi:hypothetical protein